MASVSGRRIGATGGIVRWVLHRLRGATVEVFACTTMPHGDDWNCILRLAFEQEKRAYPLGRLVVQVGPFPRL